MRISQRFGKLSALLTLVPCLHGAVQTVCPTSYGVCTYTDLQAALAAVSCGTELDIAPIVWNGIYYYQKDCSGNPVVLTSMRKAFLPLAGERISPAHYYTPVPGVIGSSGNIPVLNTTATSAPIQIYFPTKGFHIVGVGFTTTSTVAGYTYQLINMEPTDLTNIANASDDIVLDRCYVSGPETAVTAGGTVTKVDIQTGVFVQGSNVTVENSMIKDIMYRGFESHGISGSDAIGPVSYINNFISGAGIPIFSGGNQPRFWPLSAPNNGLIPNGFTAKFNYFYKPYKWWADPVNNPYYNDYLTFGSYEPCVKNLGENKNGQNILWQYNVHENQWINSTECQGQSFGFTFTPRAESSSWNLFPASATSTATTLTWTGNPTDANGNPPQTNEFAGIYQGSYLVMRWIKSVDVPNKTLTIYNDPVIGTGFPVVTVPNSWVFGWDATEGVRNVKVQNEVFRNVNKLFNFQPIEINPDSSTGTTNYGTNGAISVQNMTVNNNLWVNNRLMCWGACGNGSGSSMWGINMFNSEEPYEPATRTLASNLVFNHNTWYSADSLGQNAYWFAMQSGSWSGSNSTPMDQWVFANNIVPNSAYGFVQSDSFGNTQIASTMAEYKTANAIMNNNSLPGAKTSSPCTGGQTCVGNITGVMTMDPQFSSPLSGILKVAPLSAFARAGDDGLDLGANVDQLALINGLTVTPGAYSVQLDWDLTSVNNEVPCVVEVTQSRNLFSGLGPYIVENAVNPIYFLQPDTDQRTNSKLTPPIISGAHRTMVIGQNVSVPDDNDGTVRSLALRPGRPYWGRLMCGGDTQVFSFVALSGGVRFLWSQPVDVSVKIQAPTGAAQATLAYGASQTLGQSIVSSPDGSGNVEFQVPVTPGSATFYQISFLVGGKVVSMPVSSF